MTQTSMMAMTKSDNMYEQQTTVIVPRGWDVEQLPEEFSVPRAKIPGYLLLGAGILNGAAFIFVVKVLISSLDLRGLIEFGISFVLFSLIGILAIVAASKGMTKRGLVVAVVVLSSLAVVYDFVEIIMQSMAVFLGVAGIHAEDEDVRNFAIIILAVAGSMLFISLLVFAVLIALIVIGSKRICQCCGAPPAQTPAAVQYQATPTAPPPY
ncbi:uncharacterized protein LOC135488346 [Lineus longissimus]|uniref:uncharacterized protein LOC135488346 n=1 Tax=Lineus longissimus TaxID=88925 RepID=UPI002B4F9D20